MNRNKKYNVYLIDEAGKKYWCVFHTDDGSIRLVFNNNIELNKLESFNFDEINKIGDHILKYGYDVEFQESLMNFKVDRFSTLYDGHMFFTVDVEIKNISALSLNYG